MAAEYDKWKNDFPTHVSILEKFTSMAWLFDKVYWKLLDKIVYRQEIDDDIAILTKIHQFENTGKIFDRKLNWKNFDRVQTVIFKFWEMNAPAAKIPNQ